MKKFAFSLLIIFVFYCESFGQYIQDSRVDSLVNLISPLSISKNMKALTGDTVVMVGGVPRLIFSRFYLSVANDWAAQYIFEKFQSFGLNVRYQINGTIKNVIATKTGTKFPNQKYIIGAHYDNILWPINPEPLDTVHGADDNCSGTCGIIEMARLLSSMNFDYTVVFAAWDEEEMGLYGSKNYADTAYALGDSIKAYINMDMLTWNYGNQNWYWAGPDSSSYFYWEIFKSLSQKFIPSYNPVLNYSENYGSDQRSFISKNYKTFNVAEYNVSMNPNYHKITDNYENVNLTYFTSLLKPTLALFTLFALNRDVSFFHKPILSSYDTTARTATVLIKFPNKLPYGPNAPRLYYKVNNGSYNYVNAYYRNLDTFKFLFPGKPLGSTIRYYFAAQDSILNGVCTYPVGGSGLNPPGTNPPSSLYSYNIYSVYNQCSNTLPKPINDFQFTEDTIQVSQSQKLVNKVKVNLTIYHPYDGDLIIQLNGPNGILNLSQGNGSSGDNYINTTFDDSASLSITQGVPPFTGSYKPQSALSFFKNQPASAPWILSVFDTKAGDTGTIASWCIWFELKTQVSVKEEKVPIKYELCQNYPNPFNAVTIIKYNLANNMPKQVTLKVYDILGKEVLTLVNDKQRAGDYQVIFNGSRLASGIYFYILKTDDYMDIKKMVLLK